jgi:hypothetical protein
VSSKNIYNEFRPIDILCINTVSSPVASLTESDIPLTVAEKALVALVARLTVSQVIAEISKKSSNRKESL